MDGNTRSVIGVTPPRRGKNDNANRLAGRTRLFGARRAQPAEAFREAVEQEVERRYQEKLRDLGR
jgi:hypothetical protein